ncbi:hypothetical protein [Streptomyces sp. NPDC058812]|uniref:hypothetical protein n=1 Tax=unclassified Streptomyces TaxID=2593676 RepID=UPI0036BE77A3
MVRAQGAGAAVTVPVLLVLFVVSWWVRGEKAAVRSRREAAEAGVGTGGGVEVPHDHGGGPYPLLLSQAWAVATPLALRTALEQARRERPGSETPSSPPAGPGRSWHPADRHGVVGDPRER